MAEGNKQPVKPDEVTYPYWGVKDHGPIIHRSIPLIL